MEKTHIHTDDASARIDAERTVEKSEVAAREEEMLAFWREHDIFNTSVEKDAPNGDFVFYDGPPFATGLPHYGHILAGTIKDAIPRFWTMNGYRVRRTWGWDCHGLPLENLIEKKLGLATKRDIEEYGVQNFNEAARATVMEYADDWKRIIPRMGRWADMDNDYKTMDSTYTESVWWVFKSLHDKGLVYEGFKSMHLCPRCGTTLSNFEVNQGYKDIKDIAVFVELPLTEMLLEESEPTTSLIVWTTTPWTLPGNMAAAVHEDYDYAVIEKKDEGAGDFVRFIVAKERLEAIFGDDEYSVVKEIKGAELVGKSYTPPFPYHSDRDFDGKERSWKIYHADYVEIGEEGTGAVHLAPAYGEEDMELAKAEGIPIVHHVGEDGRFMDFVTDFAGHLVKPKDDDDAGVTHLDADIEIVKKLKELGVLFRKENITHSYPHCWRCDTPLLNYATTSWFVEVTKFKDKLVAENKKVHWVPDYVGKNRFGRWLEGARDWAVSRQRYWGAPLPIWRNPETKEYRVFGSLAELQEHVPKSGNTYLTMRHAESEKNVAGVVTGEYDAPYPLTDRGRDDIKTAAVKDLAEGIDLIITSPVLRARQTAELVAEELGLDASRVVVDERVRETAHGGLEGKSLEEYRKCFPQGPNRFTTNPEGIENWTDVKRRVGEFMFDTERSHQGKRILIISHGDPLGLLHAAARGCNQDQILATWDELYPDKGVVRDVAFTLFPHNDNYELDYHRPYIDQIELYDLPAQAGGDTKLERVLDVFDCWFESGSMPYAQHHYPFEKEEEFTKGLFPANFIAEGLDQTRGWFYSLIVLGTALFGKSPYQNVIVNGTILAEDGQKMSKRLQNYPDPMDVAQQYGADAMRFYLLSSSAMRAEDLNFSEKEVAELQRKNIGRLHNVLAMYELHASRGETASFSRMRESSNVLDKWIIARTNELVARATEGFKNYELDRATRPVADFIDDLSVWYVRRSRDRLKGEEATETLGTLRYVLKTLALVMAPSMPFYAEYLYRRVRFDDDPESVHLADWPEGGSIADELLSDMTSAREIVRRALEARMKAGIKVRQPIAVVTGPAISSELQQVILEEVNAKVYQVGDEVAIDTTLTPELRAEGAARELMRAIQNMRKEAGLEPHDRIALTVAADDAARTMVETYRDDIVGTVGAQHITFGDTDGEEITAGEYTYTVALRRITDNE